MSFLFIILQSVTGFASRTNRCLLLLVLAAMFPAVSSLSAQTTESIRDAFPPWEREIFSGTPAELVSAAERLRPKDSRHVAILMQERYVTYSDQGSARTRSRIVYQVLDDQGINNWSAIEVGYSPWHEEKPTVRARISNPDGSMYEVGTDDLIEAADRQSGDMYSDTRLLRAPYPKVTLGSVIEEEVITLSRPLVPSGGVMGSWSFGRPDSVVLNRLVVDAPAGMPVSFRSIAENIPLSSSEKGGRSIRTWERRNQPVYTEPDTGIPSDFFVFPVVVYSNAPAWRTLGGIYGSLVDKVLKDSDPVNIDGLSLDSADPKKTAITLMRWLNERVRYTGLELGNNSIVPVSPETVFQRGFGDCKDKATVIVSALRSVGIKAWVAVLLNGNGTDVLPDVSGMDFFNHAIVWVEADDPFFVDPTVDYNFDGGLPWWDQGRYALIAKPDSPGLIPTPVRPAAENLIMERREAFFPDLGNGSVAETTTYYGTMDSYYRNYYGSQKPADVTKNFESYVSRHYESEMGEQQVQSPMNYDSAFSVSVTAKETYHVWTGEELAQYRFPTSMFWDLIPAVLQETTAKPRRHPFAFLVPLNLEARSVIHLPSGFVYRGRMPDLKRTIGNLEFSREMRNGEDHTLVVSVRVVSTNRIMTAEEFEATKRGLASLKREIEEMVFKFEPESQNLISQGKFSEAFDVHERLIALFPDRPIHRIRMTTSLLNAGLGFYAHAVARETVRLDPRNDEVWANLGWVLQFDEFGTRFGPGHDREGAISAYRKAVELAPEVWYHKVNLAVLLEHDRAGIRYSDMADMEGALGLYQEVGDDLPTETYGPSVWTLLVRTGQYEEAEMYTERLTDDTDRNAAKLILDTIRNGAETAYFDALAEMGADERVPAAEVASETLFNMRRYQESAGLLRQNAQGHEQSLDMENRADLMQKVEIRKASSVSAESPVDAVRRYIGAYGDFDGKNLSVFSGVLSERMFEYASDRRHSDSIPGAWVTFARRSVEQGMTIQNLIDISTSFGEFTQTGDESTGWVVRYQESSSSTIVLFFILPRGDGAFRVAATISQPWLMGANIRESIADGHPGRALTWLGWTFGTKSSEISAAGFKFASNPFEEPAYAFYWPKASQDDRYASLVASVLQARAPERPEDLRELEAFEQAYRGGVTEKDALQWGTDKRRLELAHMVAQDLLLRAYLKLNVPEQALVYAELMYNTDKNRVRFAANYALVLRLLGRQEEATGIVEDYFARYPGNLDARQLIVTDRLERLDMKGVQDLVSGRDSTLRDYEYNAFAWNSLFTGGPDVQALDYARKAVTMSKSGNPAILHTLAALYAKTGRLQDAQRFLSQSVALKNGTEADGNDWLILGILSEAYGLNEAATLAYRKVLEWSASELPSHTSSAALAAQYLKGMGP